MISESDDDSITKLLPITPNVLKYVKSKGRLELMKLLEASASCAIEGNELGIQLRETIDRLLSGKPIGERYLFQLAWMLRDQEKGEKTNEQ
jgi:hypothetical protein